jgi:probable O-glycosylation ligase (exosortase A-associated)
MRDLALSAVIVPWILLTFKRPWMGVLLLAWLGYMNPHRLAYGFAREAPWFAIAACVTLFAIFISSESKWIPWTREALLLFVFVLWTNVTVQFALSPNTAWREWDRFMKIQLIMFTNLMVMKNRTRLDALVWTIVLSFGFYGVKGGLWAIMTGGVHRVQGPEASFIEDNNHLAVALNMTIPLMRYLQLNASSKYIRLGLGGAMALTMMAVVCSYSRAGFLALGVVVLLLWLKSRKKVLLGIVLASCLAAILTFMPQQWLDRMHTINEYQEDGSAQGRLNAWQFAMNLANDHPIVGGGFRTFTTDLFRQYAPNPDDHHEAHSIYFEILAEQGYPGLLMFLLLGFVAWRSAAVMRRQVRGDPKLQWAGDLMSMVQVSIAAYACGGAFVSLAYFDYPYHLIVLVILTKTVVRMSERDSEQSESISMTQDTTREVAMGT